MLPIDSKKERLAIFHNKYVQLDWSFGKKMFDDDRFFGAYDDDEIRKQNKKKSQDAEDYLRNDDMYLYKNGTLDKDHCLKPFKCDKKSSKYGEEKLCINRKQSNLI